MDLSSRSLSAPSVMPPVARRIRLNAIWLLLTRLITQAQLVLFTVLVARRLGVSGFGQYAFVAALIVLGNVATTFGTDTLLIREIARDRQAQADLSAAALWMQLLLSGVWLMVVALGANLLADQSPAVMQALQVYSLSLIPLAFFTVFTAVLRAHERMDLYMLLNVVIAFLQLGGAWLVLQGQSDLLSLVMMLNVVQLGAAVLAGVVCYRHLPAFQFHVTVARDRFVQVARLAWPFALLSVLVVLYQRLGVITLSAFGMEIQAGWFAAATRVTEPAKMLHFAVLGALLPALSYLAAPAVDKQHNRLATDLFRRSLWFLLSVSALAAGLIAVLAQPIVMVLFGVSYAPAAMLVQLLAVSLIPYTISASLAVQLVTQKQERRVLWITALSVLLAFLLNSGLIPAYGSVGAALAVVGSESFLAVLLLVVRRWRPGRA